MNALMNYGSDDDDSGDGKQSDYRGTYTKGYQNQMRKLNQAAKQEDVNYEEVGMDLSEDSNDSTRRGQPTSSSERGSSGKDESSRSERDNLGSRYSRDSDYKGSRRDERSRTDDRAKSGRTDERTRSDRYSRDEDRKSSSREDDRDSRRDRSDRDRDRDRYREDRHRDRRDKDSRDSRDSRDRRSRRSSSRDRDRRRGSRSPKYDRRSRRSSRSRSSRSRSRSRSSERYRRGGFGGRFDRGPKGLAYDKPDTQRQEQKPEGEGDTNKDRFFMPGITGRFRDQIERRKLLWQKKETPAATVTKATAAVNNGAGASRTTKVWEATTFAQDQDGKVASKFKRLMGIKSESMEANKPVTDVLKRQEEMFTSMEAQYEVARTATHTMRGVGLGFGSFQR